LIRRHGLTQCPLANDRKQQTLTGFAWYATTTRRAQFLADMDRIVLRQELTADNHHRRRRDIKIKKGSIVYATIIGAASSIKNRGRVNSTKTTISGPCVARGRTGRRLDRPQRLPKARL
jgi:hypothetical protein